MRQSIRWILLAAAAMAGAHAQAQAPLTWQQVRAQFGAANPTLRAGQINIDESKAAEITAYLRPNPGFSFSVDQLQPFNGNPYRPLTYAFPMISLNYLRERDHKRELRRDSAQEATAIDVSQQADLIRTLVFTLRSAFVSTLQAKAVLALAKDNLDYFDRELAIARDRLAAGDIAQLDLKRLQLQRVQYESDYQTAQVNLRTAKIQLLQLLNERTPVDQFDVTGPFDFSDRIMPLDEFRNLAMDTRPDLKAAAQAVDKARVDHQLAVSNGSTDPTFTFDAAHNPPIDRYFGFGVQIPLRIFDRNQGEKLRTQLDITHAERDEGCGPGTGLQRRGFGLCHPGELGRIAQTVSRYVPADGQRRARHHGVFLPARPGRPGGLSGCAERLPCCLRGLSEPGGSLPHRRRAIESGRGPRGHPISARTVQDRPGHPSPSAWPRRV
jgi:cobalt-zinc-cadmium efflux system outer membrane protein